MKKHDVNEVSSKRKTLGRFLFEIVLHGTAIISKQAPKGEGRLQRGEEKAEAINAPPPPLQTTLIALLEPTPFLFQTDTRTEAKRRLM